MSEKTVQEGSVRTSIRDALRSMVEVLGLCGLVLGQTVLATFGAAPEHLAFLGVTSSQIVGFALLVVLVPPLVVWAVDLGLRLAIRLHGAVVHAIVLGAITFPGFIQLGWRIFDLSGVLLGLLSGVGAVAFATLYYRFALIRFWTTYSPLVSVLAVLSFLCVSPVSDLVFPTDVDAGSISFTHTPPIIMLVLDELPTATLLNAEGEIDATLFPAFAEFAAESTWYRNASSVSNATVWAVPAYLTGLVPPREAEPTAADHPRSLFTALAGTYEVRADEGLLRLCPPELCEPLDSAAGGFSQLIDDAASVWREQVSINGPSGGSFDFIEKETAIDRPEQGLESSAQQPRGMWGFMETNKPLQQILQVGRATPARFQSFLDAIEPSDKPTFDYLHLLLPHTPWRYYPSGVKYIGPTDPTRGQDSQVWTSEVAAKSGRQRHVLQTQYADRLLGLVIERLRSQSMFDDALVVVIADHGIAFEMGETRRSRGSSEPPAEMVDLWWSPLFIKEPRQSEGVISDLPVQAIDLLPTIFDLLGSDASWEMDGMTASELGAGNRLRTLCFYNRVNIFEEVWECNESETDSSVARLVERGLGRHLPGGGGKWRPYRDGPYPELVGRPVIELEVEDDLDPQVVNVAGLDAFDSVKPNGTSLPGLLAAQLENETSGIDIAIALNGSVVATTTTFTSGGAAGMITAILADFAFREGSNELGLFIITEGPNGAVLARCQIAEPG